MFFVELFTQDFTESSTIIKDSTYNPHKHNYKTESASKEVHC